VNRGAGWLEHNPWSYVTMFTIVASAYFVALLFMHMLAPRLEPVRIENAPS